MERQLSESTKYNRKTPYRRNSQGAVNSPTNEVQNEASNQNVKQDKLCSPTEKLFALMVEKQSPPSENYVNEDERNNDLCNPSSKGT